METLKSLDIVLATFTMDEGVENLGTIHLFGMCDASDEEIIRAAYECVKMQFEPSKERLAKFEVLNIAR